MSMPITTGSYSYVETQIYNFLINTLKYNNAVACGILANIEAESSFNPGNLNPDDKGKPSYGLCQWRDTRYNSLVAYAGTPSPSVAVQLNFLGVELGAITGYSQYADSGAKLFHSLARSDRYESNDLASCRTAAVDFFEYFERGDSTYTEDRKSRADKFFDYYSKYGGTSSGTVDLGSAINRAADNRTGRAYPGLDDSEKDRSFIAYSYWRGGYENFPVTNDDAEALHTWCVNNARRVMPSDIRPADIMFDYMHDGTDNSTGLPILRCKAFLLSGKSGYYNLKLNTQTIGDHTRIWYTPTHIATDIPTYYADRSDCSIYRILSEAESLPATDISDTSGGESSNTPNTPTVEYYEGTNAVDYIALTAINVYSDAISGNLSKVKERGYDYGYLIDMTHGGEFKFYIPGFTEQAGANWTNVDLRGRSVNVMAYESTNSRSIQISLELYAGEGLYKPSTGESASDALTRMHVDADFVKSLEYPDYTTAIVRPPSTVHLILGSNISLVGVVSDVVVEHLKPLDEQNRSMYIKVSFKVTQTEVNPPDYSDIRNNIYSNIKSNLMSLDSISIGDLGKLGINAGNINQIIGGE